MKTFFLVFGLLAGSVSFGQRVETRLTNAMQTMEKDEQFKHAIISLYIVDSKTGKVVFDKNSQIGLAPASCLKVVTSASAFEILGKNYTYKTAMGYNGTIKDSTLNGDLFFTPAGDPTLGSWRWTETKEENVKQKILTALKAKNISLINGNMILDDSKWESQATPGGWLWEDVGNYYGAGARGINWHENQYDLILKSGKKVGDSVSIIDIKPGLQVSVLLNELKTGKEGSGDQSIIYLPEDGLIGYIRGTIPLTKDIFTVSGSIPNTAIAFLKTIEDNFKSNGIELTGRSKSAILFFMNHEKIPVQSQTLLTLSSPPLDSINYWFLQKSINLYGEAFVKTISSEKTGFGATDTGLNIIKDFWSKNGIEISAMNIKDGSGLSPASRVTTNALVAVMQYAKKQNWFSSFYNALPEMNAIKMKSGYIGGVRSYTGYIKSKTGAEYTFSFIINNFNGNPGAVREKMWRLLDLLK